MKTYKNPNQKKWAELIKRPVINQLQLSKTVEEIIQDVSDNGDEALFKYTQRFDGVTLSKLEVREKEIENSIAQTPQSLKAAINIAYNNIKAFHMAQQRSEATVETMPGVRCWRKSVAIEKVGLYIPGGTAPLFSTILMLGIPAQIAGCKEIVLCTPPNKNKTIDPVILYTANL
jgi:histidinol dehydrogenase